MNPFKLTETQIDGLRSCLHRRRSGRMPGAPKGVGSRLTMMRKLERMGLIRFSIPYAEIEGKWYITEAGQLILALLRCQAPEGK